MPAGNDVLAATLVMGLSLVAAGACSSPRSPADQGAPAASASPAPPNAVPGPPASGSAAGPAAPTARQAPPELVTGGSSGLAVIDAGGKVTRRLSKTPTSHPRWTADRQALVFLADSGELRRFELATGKETVIARLPATLAPCAGKTIDRTELQIESDEDFAFEKGGGAICVRLQDRNINMANIIVAFSVALGTGKVTPTIEMSECDHDPGAMLDGCRGELPDRHSRRNEAARPFAISEGVLVHGKSRRTLGRSRDYREEKVSPSGKWAIVGGNLSNGDYIERDVFLFDRDTGKLYPLPASTRTWPSPIPGRDLGKLPSWSGRTIMAVGETTILWLGPGDAVAIGQALVVPGVRITHFEGDLAR
jgi:hypothetical protein